MRRRFAFWAAAFAAVWPMGVASAGPSPETSADTGGGREVFVEHCAMCHGQDASGMAGMHPSLRGAERRLSREGVEVAIRKGRNTTPPMPAWEGRLNNDEISDVVDYIASLPAGPRNFANEPGDGGMMGGDGMMGGGSDGMTRTGWALLGVSTVAAALIGGVTGFALRARRGRS